MINVVAVTVTSIPRNNIAFYSVTKAAVFIAELVRQGVTFKATEQADGAILIGVTDEF